MPETALLDTDVLLYLTSKKPEAEPFVAALAGKAQAVSFATAGEIVMHTRRSPNPDAEKALARIVLGQVVHVGADDEVSRRWGELAASSSKNVAGRPRHSNDLWTAAVALRYGLPLATNNRVDFEGIPGLRLLP